MVSKYQIKSITEVDDYECKLSDELQRIAKTELGETDENRTASIREMREWILGNPRIIMCRMDSKFILRFLRFKKFRIPEAKESFERYLIFREGVYGYDWFSNLDFCKPNISDLIDKGKVIVLPKRDVFGRIVVLSKCAAIDPKIPTIGCESLTLDTMVLETLLEDEENQIRGLNYIIDVSNIKLRHYFIFSFPAWFKIAKNVEKTCTLRHKGFHVVNIHPTLQFIANLTLKHMPEKLRKRVKFYSSFDEIDVVDRENFPFEFGGKANMKELTDSLKATLSSKKDFFLNYKNMKVDHSAYPKKLLRCDVETLNTPIEKLNLNEMKKELKQEEVLDISEID